jgi:hypothetical protein
MLVRFSPLSITFKTINDNLKLKGSFSHTSMVIKRINGGEKE